MAGGEGIHSWFAVIINMCHNFWRHNKRRKVQLWRMDEEKNSLSSLVWNLSNIHSTDSVKIELVIESTLA
jgi:hypothetical protein